MRAFLLGMREFRSDVTTHFDEPEIQTYDLGREWAHRLTLRRWDDRPLKVRVWRRKPPTIANGAEVFDSEGTLAIMCNGIDVAHLSRVEGDLGPTATDEQYQQIIDAIVKALRLP